MEGHETMTLDQAILAVVHGVGAVVAREIAFITTVHTEGYLLPFSSIMTKNFLEVSVPVCEPILHELGACSLFGFLFYFGISFSGIVMLYIGLICNIFGECVIG